MREVKQRADGKSRAEENTGVVKKRCKERNEGGKPGCSTEGKD